MSEGQLPIAAQGAEVFKGSFRVVWEEEGGGQDGTVSPDSHFGVSDAAVASILFSCFEGGETLASAFVPCFLGQLSELCEVEWLMSQLLSGQHVVILSSCSHLLPPGRGGFSV